MEIARKKGKTLYSYINSLIKYAIKAENLNAPLYDQVNIYQYYLHAFKSNFILVPLSIFIYGLRVNLQNDRERVFIEWRNFGIWYAEFTKIKYHSIEEMEKFETTFFNIANSKIITLKMSRIRKNEALKNDGEITYQAQLHSKNPEMQSDFLLCYYYFFQGFFETYEFAEEEKSISENIITITVSRSLNTQKKANLQESNMSKMIKEYATESSGERKIFAVSKDLAEKLNDIAKKRHVTLFKYFNENVLQSTILAESYGIPLRTILEEHEGFRILNEIDMIFVPASIAFFLAEFASKDPAWENKWHETGTWTGQFLKIRFKEMDFSRLLTLARITFHPHSRIEMKVDLEKISNKDYDLTLKLYGRTLPESLMLGIATYYEGLCEELGYRTAGKNVSFGICVLNLKKS
ncbi:MAG: hypothetical protein ACTSRW_11215 [Candidatus Helarchaeota archaeon]